MAGIWSPLIDKCFFKIFLKVLLKLHPVKNHQAHVVMTQHSHESWKIIKSKFMVEYLSENWSRITSSERMKSSHQKLFI